VPLVLNPATGSITTQWNVVFDGWFATISSSEQDLPDFNVEDWSNMFGATTSHFPDEIPSEDEPGQPDDAPRRDTIATKIDQLRPPVPLPLSSEPDSPPQSVHPILQREKDPLLQREQDPQPAPSPPIPSPTSPLMSPQFEQREDTSVDVKTETPQREDIPSSHQRPSRQC